MQNLKDAVLPTEAVALINAKLEEIRGLIPFAVGLSAGEKMSNPALGARRTKFVEVAVESARQYPELLPSFLNATTFESEFSLFQNLFTVHVAVQQLDRLVADTMHLAGNQVLAGAREFYNTVKRASESNVPGAMAVKASLQIHYTQGKSKKENGVHADAVAQPLS